jgi:hypothetical protein
MKITPAAASLFADELRLRDPDAFMLLEIFRFDHGDENVFELSGEVVRRAGGSWPDERFYGALSRLIAMGFMVAVRETIQ